MCTTILKILTGLMLFTSLTEAKDITPLFTLKTSGLVSDFVIDGNRLYAATSQGSIDIFDLETQKVVDRIILQPIRTVRGELIPAQIFSIDRIEDKTLLVSKGKNGYRDVWIYEGFELKKVIGEEKKLFVKKARFANNGDLLLGTFGSDVILHDEKEGYQVYQKHISESALGGIALSADKKKVVMSDESGSVRLIDVASSQVDKVFSSEHVDNIYRVAYSNGIILTAGQDRRVGVYYVDGREPYHLKSDFLVYCVALSPSGKKGIYSSGTDHKLQLFDVESRKKTTRLFGHHAVINKIKFMTENILVSAGDERHIYVWSLDVNNSHNP